MGRTLIAVYPCKSEPAVDAVHWLEAVKYQPAEIPVTDVAGVVGLASDLRFDGRDVTMEVKWTPRPDGEDATRRVWPTLTVDALPSQRAGRYYLSELCVGTPYPEVTARALELTGPDALV